MPLKSHCGELQTTLEVEREKQDEVQTPPSILDCKSLASLHLRTFWNISVCVADRAFGGRLPPGVLGTPQFRGVASLPTASLGLQPWPLPLG